MKRQEGRSEAGGHLSARMGNADLAVPVARVVPISPLSELGPLMATEMNRTLKSRTKTSVMDTLYARNPVTLPDALVESEIKDLIAPQIEHAGKSGQPVDEAELHTKYEAVARRRVGLAGRRPGVWCVAGAASRLTPPRVLAADPCHRLAPA